MSKLIDFEAIKAPTEDDDNAVFIENTPEITALAKNIDEACAALGLTNGQSEGLVAPIMAFVAQCRHDAFKQGFSLGLEIGKDLGTI